MTRITPDQYTSSYNDSTEIVRNPAAYDVAYMRGATIWYADKTDPRPCQKFYLSTGLADDWQTLDAEMTKVETIGPQFPVKPVIFRLIEFDHVPVGWPILKVRVDNRDRTFVDFRKSLARAKYRDRLTAFAARFGSRLYAIDIPFPFGFSNEPDVRQEVIDVVGENDYIAACKWVIDLYAELFPRKCIGNLGGRSDRAEVLLPYQQQAGIKAWRQDALGRFRKPWGMVGENRATMYDERFNILNNSDDFVFFETAGDGIQREPDYPTEQMVGARGEFWQLEACILGNMGSPWSFVDNGVNPLVPDIIRAFEDYVEGSSAPGDGGIDPPVDPDPITRAEFEALKIRVTGLERQFAAHSHSITLETDGPGYKVLPL